MQRTLAIKLTVIGLLGLLMLIPLGMIQSKIGERALFQLDAANSIQQSWTGPQTVMTPVLVIPYSITEKKASTISNGFIVDNGERNVQKYRLLHPDQVSVDGEIKTHTLARGIYEVPVYRTRLTMSGEFKRARIEGALDDIRQTGGEVNKQKSLLALYIADARGISGTTLLQWNGEAAGVEPGSGLPGMPEGMRVHLPTLESATDFAFELGIDLRGMESLSVIPAGNDVEIALSSKWPHPEFVGAFLPENRRVDEEGFSADWRISRFASNIGDKLRPCESGNCQELLNVNLGVRLIEPVAIYLQSERSVKYGILFVGLSFVAFFVFEHLKAIRIHPIQYGLVGFSIATFYLLLLSLSEHIHFGLAYAIATFACVLVNLLYLKFVLAGTGNALVFCVAKIALFAALYVVIQAEDFALLMGASLVFAALAIVMLITRDVDWYTVGEQVGRQRDEKNNVTKTGSSF